MANNIMIKTTLEEETTSWESIGELIKEGEVYKISYPDYASNTKTDNELFIKENSMHLLRSGAFTSDLVFEENMMTVGKYNVMFYNSDVEVFTNCYDFSENDETLNIRIDYQILDGEVEIANNVMEIMINK